MNYFSPRYLALGLAACLSYSAPTLTYAQTNVTPGDFLASQPKPIFTPGHRLPRLTRWGWPLSSNATVQLATNWGYTLDLGLADRNAVMWMKNPKNTGYGFIQLAKKYPTNYVLSVNVERAYPTPIPAGFWCTNAQGLFVDQNSNTWSSITNTAYGKVVCPEAPDEYWKQAADYWTEPLRAIQSNAPISIVLNGGEIGIGVPGSGAKAWKQDPRVQAKLGGRTWSVYASERNAHHLGIVADAIREALPKRDYLIYYALGNEERRTGPTWQANWMWGADSKTTRNLSDIPTFESYYLSANTGWTGNQDMLTLYLNAVGYFHTQSLGDLSYGWLSAGWWTNTNGLSDIPRYMGFLKCAYTGGMIGGVAGYFAVPPGGLDAPFAPSDPPHWLRQIQALSHVHALFTRVEKYLWNGDLLPGPKPHAMSYDQPAYEFPTGDATARVLARKLRGEDQWLVTAWAAAGADRVVSVTIPTLGTIKVKARAAGSVYEATPTSLTHLDVNGLFPSQVVTPARNLRFDSN